jgi:transposase
MLDYRALAKKLGVSYHALTHKIAAYNRKAGEEGTDKIYPDAELPVGRTKHLFKADRVQEIKEALETMATRGRGRPRKTK